MLGDDFVSNAIMAKSGVSCSTNVFALICWAFEGWIIRDVGLDLFIKMSKKAMLVQLRLPFEGSTRAKHTII